MSNIPNKSLLPNLPAELLTGVVCKCDLKDVAHMKGTCKCIKNVCDPPPVQKHLLQSLDVTRAPNITPYDRLDSLLPDQMCSKFAEAVGSSHRWLMSGKDKRYAQEASLRITPHTQFNHGGSDEKYVFMRPRLLPGGHYALLVNRRDLQLWSLEHSTCVWVAKPPHTYNLRNCDTFDFELLQDGKFLIIAAGFSNPTSRSVCVYKFDFESRNGTCVFKCGIPYSSAPPQLMVRGKLVMSFVSRGNQINLFNWKKSEAVILDYDHVNVGLSGRAPTRRFGGHGFKPHPDHVFINHHIVTALRVGTSDIMLAAISVSSLDGKWTNVQIRNWTEWKHAVYSFSRENGAENRDVLCLTLPRGDGRHMILELHSILGMHRMLGMHAFTPAWYPKTKTENTAEIFVAAYEILEDKTAYLVSYRVQLSGRKVVATSDIAWHLSLIAQDRAAMSTIPQPSLYGSVYNISNSGSMFSRIGPEVHCHQLFCKDQQPVGYGRIPSSARDADRELVVMSVEPVSGAVLIVSQGLLRVARFGS
ncbi:hypothetical protein DFH11DRAFT_1741950 [Phellopilus nigrolimitatus]|nr:hypothetical protein DFH11DRAFT_1741950 [Phellopilus nigrolimitatus]